MKTLKATFSIIFSLLLMAGQAQEKMSRVRLTAPDLKTLQSMISQLEIDHYYESNGGIISEVSADLLSRYRTSRQIGNIEILTDDVAAELEQENARYFADRKAGRLALEQPGSTVGSMFQTPAAFQVKSTFGGYYSFAEMEAAMNTLVATYPSIASKTSLGFTADGNNVWCIKISDNVSVDETNEPEVLYFGLQHAREAIGGASMIFFMQYLCENYATDQNIKDLVDNRELFIIPCMNPDGWEYNRTTAPNGGGGWRKNRRRFRVGGTWYYGADLNRNWGQDWANCPSGDASCGSNNPSSAVYWGQSAFSEPETQIIRDFVYTRHFVTMIDQHSYGPYYSIPFGRQGLHTMSTADAHYYDYLTSAMGKYNGMRAGNSYQALHYEVAGGVKDWMLMGNIGTGTKGKVYGMTGEGGAGNGTGGSYGKFWPPANQIINLCKGMLFQDLQLAYSAGSYIDLQDRADLNLMSTTGSLPFEATRVGLEDRPVTITLVPIQNIIAGAPVTISSLPNYFDKYNGSISYTLPAGITTGQVIKYAWRIETGGYTYSDTITKFYSPVVMFQDDMESGSVGSKWLVNSGWNYSSSDPYQGSRSLTESPGGHYSRNQSLYARNRTTFDLSDATAAYISFYTRFAAENFRDKLQVQVSTNSGSSWTAIQGTTTIQEPGTVDGSTLNGQPSLTGIKQEWTHELFSLEDYLGNSNVQFRFLFTSDDSTSATTFWRSQDEGFSIDNVVVAKSTSTLTTLPVNFLSFKAFLQGDRTGLLTWDAQTDDMHDHFEVERSQDGYSFTSIATIAAGMPMHYVDAKLNEGNNYYRIKQVDKDGHVTYSSTLNLWLETQLRVNISPNPVSDHLQVELKGLSNDLYTVKLRDMNGKLYFHQQKQVNGQLQMGIPMQQLSSQLYLVTVTDSRGQTICSQKIIKQ